MDKMTQLRQILGRPELELSPDQFAALEVYGDFIREEHAERQTMLLTGSAGTGKTFLIDIISRLLRKDGYKVILLAPTGRAAKVIARRAQRPAYTIHHHIYSPRDDSYGELRFNLKANKEKDRVCYIVDEASMIGDHRDGSSSQSLLRNLMQYVFQGEASRRLILVGDPVQLPPVGHSESPALDPEYLTFKLDLVVYHAHLTDVKRQMVDSGVLENAVRLRDAYQSGAETVQIVPDRDVLILEQAYEAVETYMGYHEDGNPDRVVFLTYSNYLATRVNQGIRHELHQTEELLVPSDLIMVVKNNYTWGDNKRMPFIANGEMGTVREVYAETRETRYGLNWVEASVEFTDTRGEPMLLDVMLVLDLLQNKQAQLENDALYRVLSHRQAEYRDISPTEAASKLRTDPYVNALQIKYGYAVTGHKAQGGQWENVLIAFEPDYGQNPQAYLRWTYTVCTRAEARLFLLNCPFVETY
ncbi:MAG: ATP-dependent endonuclease [Bacteroidetes bacterium]|nr:MAG: ATP-dependent endonuclease [Bacteroidota bacterium]